jgi:hypothetical protein
MNGKSISINMSEYSTVGAMVQAKNMANRGMIIYSACYEAVLRNVSILFRPIVKFEHLLDLDYYLTIVATQCEEPSGRSMATVLPPAMVLVGPHSPVPILTQLSSNFASG